MISLDQDKLHKAVVEQIAAQFIADDNGAMETELNKIIRQRVDTLFKDRVETLIVNTIDKLVKDGFTREYCAVDAWGVAKGEKTSISKELEKLVTGYWSEMVDPKNGKIATASYIERVTRAQYVMMSICAADFNEQMKTAAISVTGALKDGLRKKLAEHMDQMLGDLFRVKSLQDQGKASKPW